MRTRDNRRPHRLPTHRLNLGLPVLQHLATVYADHPDYRDEWRP
ncbi:DUF6221 family protein [Streptomyces sp. NPDC017529]